MGPFHVVFIPAFRRIEVVECSYQSPGAVIISLVCRVWNVEKSQVVASAELFQAFNFRFQLL